MAAPPIVFQFSPQQRRLISAERGVMRGRFGCRTVMASSAYFEGGPYENASSLPFPGLCGPSQGRGAPPCVKLLPRPTRGERVPFKIPRSVQQSIPIQRVWQDGIWQVNGRFSQTWRFADINYSLASYEDQRDMFTSYCGVLNSLPTDAVTKITIHNRRLNSSDFQHSVLMRECGDDLDLYRREYNRVLTEKAAASNNLIQDKYITVSVARKNAEEARAFFHRVDADLSKNHGASGQRRESLGHL